LNLHSSKKYISGSQNGIRQDSQEQSLLQAIPS